MGKIIRSFLTVANKIILAYCLVCILVLGWPATGFIIVIAVVLRLARRGYRRLTTLGSARWANGGDLKRAGMLGSASGVILGRLPTGNAGLPKLRRQRVDAASLVRLPNAVHTVICAPTGVGKGVSLVVPHLLTSDKSAVIVDFKGELATLTADHRRKKLGHQIVLIDPYQQVTQKPDTFNALDFIAKDHPLSIDDCNDLANSLVIRTGHEAESHWNDSGETVISAIVATVVGYGEASTRSLQTVREIISKPPMLELAIKLMTESDRWGGALNQMGGQLMHFADKERASVLSTALRHLKFLGTPAIAASTKCSSFDPAQLRSGKMSVYLILPADRAHANAGLLRMWVSSLMRACMRGGLQ